MACEDYPVFIAFIMASLVTPVVLLALRHGSFVLLSAILSFILSLYTVEHGCGWIDSTAVSIALFSVLISSILYIGVVPRRLNLENVVYATMTPVVTTLAAGVAAGKNLIPLGYGVAVSAGVAASMLAFVAISVATKIGRRTYYVIKG